MFRSPQTGISLEWMFGQDRVTNHYKAVTLNCILADGCVYLLRRFKESVWGEKHNREDGEGRFQQLLIHFLLKSSFSLTTEVSTRGLCEEGCDFN